MKYRMQQHHVDHADAVRWRGQGHLDIALRERGLEHMRRPMTPALQVLVEAQVVHHHMPQSAGQYPR
jgi:hypothetical protein